MRKKLRLAIVIGIIMIMCGQAYAADYDITPYYNVVSAANSTISSEDDGVAMNVFITTAGLSDLDRVYVSVTLKKASTGVTMKSYNKYMEDQGSVFLFSETYKATSSGYYIFEYTAKCYKNNVLVDTITGTSASVYHSV